MKTSNASIEALSFTLHGSKSGADKHKISYFGSNETVPVAKDRDAIGKLFEKYHGQSNPSLWSRRANPSAASTDDKDTVGFEGTMTYLNDLGVNLENAEILVVLEILQAPSLGEISKQGFVDGWSTIG